MVKETEGGRGSSSGDLSREEICRIAAADYEQLPKMRTQHEGWRGLEGLANHIEDLLRTKQEMYLSGSRSQFLAMFNRLIDRGCENTVQVAVAAGGNASGLDDTIAEVERLKERIDALTGEASDAQTMHTQDPHAFDSLGDPGSQTDGLTLAQESITDDMRAELATSEAVYETAYSSKMDPIPEYEGAPKYNGPGYRGWIERPIGQGGGFRFDPGPVDNDPTSITQRESSDMTSRGPSLQSAGAAASPMSVTAPGSAGPLAVPSSGASSSPGIAFATPSPLLPRSVTSSVVAKAVFAARATPGFLSKASAGIRPVSNEVVPRRIPSLGPYRANGVQRVQLVRSGAGKPPKGSRSTRSPVSKESVAGSRRSAKPTSRGHDLAIKAATRGKTARLTAKPTVAPGPRFKAGSLTEHGVVSGRRGARNWSYEPNRRIGDAAEGKVIGTRKPSQAMTRQERLEHRRAERSRMRNRLIKAWRQKRTPVDEAPVDSSIDGVTRPVIRPKPVNRSAPRHSAGPVFGANGWEDR